MERFTTHGDFSWSELTTTDVGAASNFYKHVFGWTLEDMPMPGHETAGATYTVVKVEGRGIGGMVSMPSEMREGMPPVWNTYVTVKDVDAVAEAVRENGGAICAGPHDIPGVGRMIVLSDPQGASLCAIQYEAPQEELLAEK
jgi:uncharacterized protein